MDEKMMKTMFSSDKRDWETPAELFDQVNAIFDFELDVCATKENAKLPAFISPKMDAFRTSWGETRCWCNPPYGKPEQICKELCKKKSCKERGWHRNEYLPGVIDWIKLVINEVEESKSTVVMLLPARTDTAWYQLLWNRSRVMCFLRGRFKFVGASAGATFPSVLAVLSPCRVHETQRRALSYLGNVMDFQEIMMRRGKALMKYGSG